MAPIINNIVTKRGIKPVSLRGLNFILSTIIKLLLNFSNFLMHMLAFFNRLCYSLYIMAVQHEIPSLQVDNFFMPNLLMQGLVQALELGAAQEARAQQAENNLAEMREAAMIDPLTGLSNRRAFAEMYDKLQIGNRRRRTMSINQPASVLLFDIDHFKSINDTYGHDVGDDILRATAQTIDQRMRKRDMAARFGGEEFAILLPRTNVEHATKIAEQIRERAEKAGLVTLSAGVAAVDLHQPLDLSLKRADMALYSAKESGRNQVKAFSIPGLIANHGYFFNIED
jgi:diguanylate cyclase (GGDEF)-like protein